MDINLNKINMAAKCKIFVSVTYNSTDICSVLYTCVTFEAGTSSVSKCYMHICQKRKVKQIWLLNGLVMTLRK